MLRDRYRLAVEGAAKEAYLEMSPGLQATMFAALECLETDPYIKVGGVNFKESKAFRKLKKQGIDVRIFKALEIQRWRVFYYVDEGDGVVIVKEIVPRRDDAFTYGLTTPHVKRLIDNYQRWLKWRFQ